MNADLLLCICVYLRSSAANINMNSIELYKQGKVSLGLGANIARLSISEYMDLLKEYKFRINIDIEDAKSSLRYARMNLLLFFEKIETVLKSGDV
ncbi:hypothetical protein ig2599ANME_1485 [groundwater metagenome]